MLQPPGLKGKNTGKRSLKRSLNKSFGVFHGFCDKYERKQCVFSSISFLKPRRILDEVNFNIGKITDKQSTLIMTNTAETQKNMPLNTFI